jgi:FkbM family methyltransferase
MNLTRFYKSLTPPILQQFIQGKRKYVPKATKILIKNGILKSKNFIVDPKLHPEMADGTYDFYFWDYLSTIDLNGKIIYEIGAHIGYHTLCFSELVGSNGKVFSFEPNPFNRERLNQNLLLNLDLKKRVNLSDNAVSTSSGVINFKFSNNVDDGSSSGSFIDGAHMPSSYEFYESLGFQSMDVKTISIDEFHDFDQAECPSIIKIDVEGAENFVLLGAEKLISLNKTIFLIEIHSIYNMYFLFDYFKNRNYNIRLLKEEEDGRCFVVSEPLK